MDIDLPGMSGVEALAALRAAAGVAAPVCALTALAMSDDRARLLAAGFDGVPVEADRRARAPGAGRRRSL